jgi:hypothetical protein
MKSLLYICTCEKKLNDEPDTLFYICPCSDETYIPVYYKKSDIIEETRDDSIDKMIDEMSNSESSLGLSIDLTESSGPSEIINNTTKTIQQPIDQLEPVEYRIISQKAFQNIIEKYVEHFTDECYTIPGCTGCRIDEESALFKKNKDKWSLRKSIDYCIYMKESSRTVDAVDDAVDDADAVDTVDDADAVDTVDAVDVVDDAVCNTEKPQMNYVGDSLDEEYVKMCEKIGINLGTPVDL